LFVATHWPSLAIEAPIARPDLILHAGAFALWTAFLLATGYIGSQRSRRVVLAVGVVALAYAGLDELLQAIPILHRHAAVDDWIADAVGVALVVAIGLVRAGMDGNREEREKGRGGGGDKADTA
jgi:VanZ family protein